MMTKYFINLKWAINLEQTLLGGQSFRWTQSGDHFIGIFSNIVWKINLEDRKLCYEVLGELPYPNDINSTRIKVQKPPDKAKNGKLMYKKSYYENLLAEYFRLESDLESDYSFWIDAHKHFESKASKEMPLVTQLNQDIIETIFAFICSQNNHINRISSLVEKLCSNYGQKICTVDDKDFYNFPSLEMLKQKDMESHLRKEGFGYRAKYIEKTANEILKKGGLVWLNGLCHLKYSDAHDQLIKLPGIGPKVADCICLMALNFLEAVPVDTHILQIAQHYLSEDISKIKSMNLKLYRKVGDTFRTVYGPKAGVAQTVLFCKELSKFSDTTDEVPKKKKN